MERMSLDVNKMTKDQLRQHILMLAMELTQLEKENKKLKEELDTYKMARVIYNACNGFMEEDTLQELKDLGKI